MSDKTEEPTPKRLQKAREEGDSGASAQAAQAVAFLVAVTLAPAALAAAAESAATMLREVLAAVAGAGGGATRPLRAGAMAEAAASFDVAALASAVVAATAPMLAATAIAAAAATAVQTGGLVATKKLTPRLDPFDVVAGLGRLVSRDRLFAVARALAGGALVAWLAGRALRAHALDLARLPGRLPHVPPVAREIAMTLAWQSAAVGLALGAVDLLVTRATWLRRLRMSKDEVKREHKESEGDPQLKAARDRAHQEMLASATVANVRHASVVIVNPAHIACALRYDEASGDEAPVVVAAGEGDLAARIRRAAEQYNVPVVRDVPLARALRELEIGTAIPEALYEAVAEILREVWETERPDAHGARGDAPEP